MLRIKCPNCQNMMTLAAVPPGGGQVGCPTCGQQLMLNAPAVPVVVAKPVGVKPVVLRPPSPGDDDVIDLKQLPQPARPVVALVPPRARAEIRPLPRARPMGKRAPSRSPSTRGSARRPTSRSSRSCWSSSAIPSRRRRWRRRSRGPVSRPARSTSSWRTGDTRTWRRRTSRTRRSRRMPAPTA